MTVDELIEKLKTYPGTHTVAIEGCDCVGDAVDVELSEATEVMITRDR